MAPAPVLLRSRPSMALSPGGPPEEARCASRFEGFAAADPGQGLGAAGYDQGSLI